MSDVRLSGALGFRVSLVFQVEDLDFLRVEGYAVATLRVQGHNRALGSKY